VLAKEGEFIDWLNNGGSADFSGQITDTPPQFRRWVNNNTDNILRAEGRGKLPYFLRDNQYEQYLANTPQQLKISEIRRLVDGKQDSFTRFINANGAFTPERKALHDKIMADYMRNGSTQTNTAYMLGGAPANGKSTLVDSGILPHPKGILKIDPDAIKAQIPEYNRMLNSGDALLRKRAAAFVHEESSYLSKLIQGETNRQKFDFVLDGVNDGAFDKLAGKIAQIKSTGRRVRADYVSLDADLSVKLAVQRAAKTGRDVPLNFVNEMNSEVSKLVPEIIKNKTIDELYLWDTNINGKPRLILTQIDGRLKIYDRGLYNDFLRKAN
jgi:predicted ABC-type ATPase